MPETLFLATEDGFVWAELNGSGWKVRGRTLEGTEITSVIAREGVILAGTRDGVWRSEDRGRNWSRTSTGLTQPYVRWLAYHPALSDREFAGTEPAGLFHSQDGGDSWSGVPTVEQLRDQFRWFLPYSPEAGCVRGFAFHGQRAYAAVEVGGLLRSDDGGKTWALAPGSQGRPVFGRPPAGFVHPDVHSVEVHPSSPDLVWAATGGGLYQSEDGGATWNFIYDCYVRALWLDPANSDHVVFGPAEDVGQEGQILESWDRGRSWQPADTGLNTPWPHNMVERFYQAGDMLFAVLDRGELLASPMGAWQWQPILPEVWQVNAVTTMV